MSTDVLDGYGSQCSIVNSETIFQILHFRIERPKVNHRKGRNFQRILSATCTSLKSHQVKHSNWAQYNCSDNNLRWIWYVEMDSFQTWQSVNKCIRYHNFQRILSTWQNPLFWIKHFKIVKWRLLKETAEV